MSNGESNDSAVAPSGSPRRHDPIREKYFRAVDTAERGSSALFYIAGILSFAVLLVEKGAHPALYDDTQIAFIVAVTALFVVDVGIRLYWSSWAADERRLDLLSHAYGVPLTHDQTTGYYNNNETDPLRKLGAAVLENSLFSRAISLRMLSELAPIRWTPGLCRFRHPAVVGLGLVRGPVAVV